MSTVEVHRQITGDEIAHTFEEEAVPKVDLGVYAFEDWVALVIFWVMALAVFLQFFTRYVLNDSYAWTEEIATYCLIGVVFIGSSMCVRLSRHIQVDLIYRYLPHIVARALSTAIDLIRIAFFGYAIKLVWVYIQIIGDESMTTINLPKDYVYYSVLAGFVLMFLRSVQVAIQHLRQGYSILERPGAYDGFEG
ncbi:MULTISPECIES: TRAP transporter small permease [Bradyrhizobium]|jgi:TRAP-type C4-dicarboxylate transport system permease small subunit|uniref:TRAP transporter small permease n=1 Tax=Bradyrhizobium TaxID=374 RepID=UPI000231CCA3|nr:TRAP transporter small permease [Bradyrhizobium japonicum]AJA61102.1 ABC transporter permease [Bradyrhizobium japonicum]KMJ99631.1 ABC transporter permease [Bradyrhizobium japonicum]MBR0766296.1 TRAP transporter small permease [Bradyrhizobium japonicum]MCS3533859.1 TRAP-type C4-dicarboxylate transport system permease small subunit [Bradyrhizobium japonicum]MCS3990047.1 TRAP-type C4-dicarboxylate transport system permease small subunit [Bradyrhizobium japonicum]